MSLTARTLSAFMALTAVAALVYWATGFTRDTVSLSPAATAAATDWVDALSGLSSEGFERPPPGWTLDLPSDHGAHRSAQTENWQIAFHLQTEDDTPVGLQFSVLRLGIIPPGGPPPASVWDITDIYRAHVIHLGPDAAEATAQERFARAVPGLAGYDHATSALRVDDWQMTFGNGSAANDMQVTARLDNGTAFQLSMRPETTARALAPEGADAPFVGYAYTRLAVEGTLEDAAGTKPVFGTAWYDHTWGDLPIPGSGPVAWDRFQFHLADGTDISLLRARRTDGRGTATINGIVIDTDGQVTPFDEAGVDMTTTRFWRDPRSGAEYPIAWRIAGPGIEVRVAAVREAQTADFELPFWSGLITTEGHWGEIDAAGYGTMQLTGYVQ